MHCQYVGSFVETSPLARHWPVVFELRVRLVRGKFAFRQGLWIEDLQTRQGRNAATVV